MCGKFRGVGVVYRESRKSVLGHCGWWLGGGRGSVIYFVKHIVCVCVWLWGGGGGGDGV